MLSRLLELCLASQQNRTFMYNYNNTLIGNCLDLLEGFIFEIAKIHLKVEENYNFMTVMGK